ncbi:hypothetical protein TVAG_254920 [Trichomonas vaginalis G3]|uniref:MatE family protein n=1 Tax=Trichomonas vaginalis (strain ATCC PRA-98 / G3) TaxID=412133 RepID=A2EXN4_TRIV3|nr:multidrug resistance protein YPNP-related family [Trichomonas vaginalis G3]EAY02591.1 hypothetical protein TVAG_254920 [Trichomonas vaginalis G3]KAI5512563.1 multidrug resistance protein YPNP-related family [Trichomonas vaginalis G3]|eukprot:XP_001314814.1 hypothetical protein [Trichomonas vaginalis G3]
MVGPLGSQITNAFFGILNSIWISKYVGDIGTSAVGIDVLWEQMARGFGLFLMCAASTQICKLFGKCEFKEAEQVVCDLLRVALICGMVVPALLLPINKPCSKWFGASDIVTNAAFRYLLPQCVGSVFTCLFLACCGFLQAEGRTLLIGIIYLVSLGIGMGALNPLFLAVFKTGIIGPSIVVVICDGIPGIILIILYFCGVFDIKPSLKGLFKPFSHATYQGLLVGSSQLILQICMNLPGILVRKLIGKSVANSDEYEYAMAGFNTLCRYQAFINMVVLALCAGYLPAASYAYSADMCKRYLHLTFHLNWLSLVWCVITTTLCFVFPKEISKLFGKGEKYIYYSSHMLKNGNIVTFILFTRLTIQNMLQSQQKGIRAMIISVISNFVSHITFVSILYVTNKHNVVRLMYVYPISYSLGFILGSILLIKPLYEVIRKSKSDMEGYTEI